MLISNLEYFLLFIITYIIVGVLTPVMRKIAINKKILDQPTSFHKSHTKAVPYLGGVAIVVGVVIVSYVALIFSNFTAINFWLATSVLAPACGMGLVGLWDDIKNLSPLPRFIGQSLAGLVVAAVLILTNNVANPTGSTFLDILLTIVWVVGICNAINFFDNLDGGAAGTVAISSIFLAFLSKQSGQSFVAALSIVVAGATLGFLIWNRTPARIYMGDAGSLFLGVLLATLSIRLAPMTETAIASFAIPVMLLAIPILDTSVAVISRLRRRVSPFLGGKDHLSHRLIRFGFSRQITAAVLWSLSLLFGLITLLVTSINKYHEVKIVFGAVVLWLVLFIKFINTSDQ